MKRLLAIVAFVTLIAILIEVFFFAYLRMTADNHKRLIAYPLEQRIGTLEEANLQRFVDGNGAWVPDSRLGWKHRPGGSTTFDDWSIHIAADGSRVTPEIGTPRIAVFGDSFAEGSEVDDDQTWAALLQNRLEAKVAARGVSGYGPDQAALAATDFLRGPAAESIETVIVTTTMENFGRLLTTYRPFYTYPATDWQFGLKPRFLAASRVWFPPVNQWQDLSEVQDAIRAAAEVDGYLPHRVLRQEFPFSLSALPVLGEHGLLVDLPDPWETEEGRQAFGYVLDHLAGNVHDGVKVVIVLLPASRGDWHAPEEARWLSDMVEERGLFFIDARLSTATTEAETMFALVHYSTAGNRVIADIVADHLLQIRAQDTSS